MPGKEARHAQDQPDLRCIGSTGGARDRGRHRLAPQPEDRDGLRNSTVDPILLRRGFAGGESSEIGIIEHIGRKSGIRRLTPVHPEPTPMDPHHRAARLSSEWARNVLAAGHCRLQLHDDVYELDEPLLLPAGEVESLPRVLRGILARSGSTTSLSGPSTAGRVASSRRTRRDRTRGIWLRVRGDRDPIRRAGDDGDLTRSSGSHTRIRLDVRRA